MGEKSEMSACNDKKKEYICELDFIKLKGGRACA